MVELCRWVTLHFLRFAGIETPETLDLSRSPEGAASWKLGPDGAIGPDGMRLPSEIWCGVGLYREREDAARAFETPGDFIVDLPRTSEAWHALLMPVAHCGEANHLDPAHPSLFLEPSADDPGGPLVVLTTAGFVLGPNFDPARVIDFRINVDKARAFIATSPGNLARQTFTPPIQGIDGYTATVWRDDRAMMAAAYGHGEHRRQLERYKAEHTADRTSFTRLRALATAGQWEGRCPVAAARAD